MVQLVMNSVCTCDSHFTDIERCVSYWTLTAAVLKICLQQFICMIKIGYCSLHWLVPFTVNWRVKTELFQSALQWRRDGVCRPGQTSMLPPSQTIRAVLQSGYFSRFRTWVRKPTLVVRSSFSLPPGNGGNCRRRKTDRAPPCEEFDPTTIFCFSVNFE